MGDVMVISGANEGIGYHIVEAWLKLGNSAAVLDIRTDGLKELDSLYPGALLPIVCDVRDESAVAAAVRQAAEKFSAIGFCIHNACVCPFKPLAESTGKDFTDTMDVNFMGAVNLTRAVLPLMLPAKKGRIFYTSSGVGITGFSDLSAYCASKGAIEAFAKCMSLEYRGSGVTFHILQPPLTDTRSSSPLPVPKEFMALAKDVGAGLAKRLGKKRFVIASSARDAFFIRMSYLFSLPMGRLLSKMTAGKK